MSLVPFPPTFSRTWFHQLSSSWDFQSFFSHAIFPLPKICSHHSKTRRSCEIKPVNPKGNQSWTFIGGIDAEAEMPILWPPEVKSWLIGKDPNAGKDWKQEEKGMTDEMREWDKGKFSSVQSLSHVWLFATPWTAAHQAFLSISNSWSLLKLMSIEPVTPSNHLILCCPHLLPPSIFPSIRVFSNESVVRIRWTAIV